MQPILWGPIHWYGVMLALGAITGFFIAFYSARKKGLAEDVILDLFIWIMASAILGARFFFVISHLPYFLAFPEEIIFSRSGFDYYGGFFSALFVAFIYLYKKGLNVWMYADSIVPGAAFGEAISNWGCFMNGCCYGHYANPKYIPWAIPFPYLDGNKVELPFYRHPTQLYYLVIGLLIFALLVSLSNRKTYHGEVFWSYLIAFSYMKLTVGIYQETGQYFVFNFLSLSQVISLIIFSFSIGVLFYFKKYPVDHPDGLEP
jgi:phosphatidylglycerol:prolipoprotein diacylglycerol transferase